MLELFFIILLSGIGSKYIIGILCISLLVKYIVPKFVLLSNRSI